MDGQLTGYEQSLIGKTVEGRVEAVFRWGVIVDLGLSRVGLIDALYIDDGDKYEVGERVNCRLALFDEAKNKFILWSPGKIPIAVRLALKIDL